MEMVCNVSNRGGSGGMQRQHSADGPCARCNPNDATRFAHWDPAVLLTNKRGQKSQLWAYTSG